MRGCFVSGLGDEVGGNVDEKIRGFVGGEGKD